MPSWNSACARSYDHGAKDAREGKHPITGGIDFQRAYLDGYSHAAELSGCAECKHQVKGFIQNLNSGAWRLCRCFGK